MTATDPAVLFVGAFTLDTLYRVDGFSAGAGKYLAQDRVCQAAGMATAAATAAARLGGHASLWASLGDDPTGDGMLAEIVAEGVDCHAVRRVPGGRSASATIIVDDAGERWVVVDYDPLTQSAPPATELPDITRFSAVMADVRWPGAARQALTRARETGRLAILDADVANHEVLSDLASCATHIAASAPGAEILSGCADPVTAARRIHDRFGCFICITIGGSGVIWIEPGSDTVHHVPSPRVAVVDTNGAGDVFHGAFALAMAKGRAPLHAIRFASAAAALKCTVMGGRLGAPDRDSTLKLMKETYDDGR